MRWEQPFSSPETWRLTGIPLEVLSTNNLKRDDLCRLASLTQSAVKLRRAMCLRNVKSTRVPQALFPHTCHELEVLKSELQLNHSPLPTIFWIVLLLFYFLTAQIFPGRKNATQVLKG